MKPFFVASMIGLILGLWLLVISMSHELQRLDNSVQQLQQRLAFAQGEIDALTGQVTTHDEAN